MRTKSSNVDTAKMWDSLSLIERRGELRRIMSAIYFKELGNAAGLSGKYYTDLPEQIRVIIDESFALSQDEDIERSATE